MEFYIFFPTVVNTQLKLMQFDFCRHAGGFSIPKVFQWFPVSEKQKCSPLYYMCVQTRRQKH